MAQAQSADFAVGREVELYERVLSNDPANSAFKMMLLRTGGDDLATLIGYETFADLLAGPSNEISVVGYSRKTLTNADLDPWAPSPPNGTLLTLPLQTFASLATGQTIDHVVVGYDNDTTGGTDADILVVTVAEARIDGIAIPTLADDVICDYSSGWVLARSQLTGNA